MVDTELHNKTMELQNAMGTQEKNSKSREAKAKVKKDPGKLKNQYNRKKPSFAPRLKFDRSCRALTGQTFSGHRTNDFNVNLDNMVIYVGATYGHEMGITLKVRKEAVIPQPYDPEENVTKSTKYIW